MLEIKNVSYRYEEFWLLKNVNLVIRPGEVIGLFGPSGSGKTTLAKIAAGYLKPREGEVIIDQRIQGTNREKHPNPVQLIWQHPEKSMNPRWRMKEVLKEAGEPSSEILSVLEIKEEWLNRWPSELSGGELQRFQLARALISTSQYLIADEMTAMLDAVSQANIWHAVLHLMKKHQIGMLAISHDKRLLEMVSDRLICW
ncbi:ABC transporter ATP-binding protein [Alteribacillus iranensis]|uniref:Peptide/nickel transport system ATP-binding protein n=1 Tax=Alteribacillus iranensis TaxID=930128 RepID=A0A1I2BDP8_9BACI|nr:ATP-binding cassette domain-containing protein [Alteribacillus iranensis]SFE54179.1 peptide/nickel transport system ATP-binding protein [Alteribacillus iranensis]